jgi:LacI family transcriptional regulator
VKGIAASFLRCKIPRIPIPMSVRSIARTLGISPTAVSLALKNSHRVSQELRDKIRKLAKQDGYVPNARLSELMSEVSHSQKSGYRATFGALSLFPEQNPWENGYPHLKHYLDGAKERAEGFGYRLEYFWLKEAGMTPKRLAAILEARGIQGLLCLGSRNPEETFPEPLRKFSVVTFAASIPSKLHRVSSHFAVDARTLYDQLLRRGYKRPGLVILSSGDRRTSYTYSETFLGMQERLLPEPHVPILRAEVWDETQFHVWFTTHHPDILVLHEHSPYLKHMEDYLKQQGLHMPEDLGLALLDMNPDQTRYSGICQNFPLMGATAIEKLIGRVMLRDFGVPEHPKIELVLGQWNEGRTLRPLPAGRRRARK